MLFFYSLSNLLPFSKDQFLLQNDQCKISNVNCLFCILHFAVFNLCKPSLSSLVMLDMAETLSLTDVRETQVKISDVRVLLQLL